MDMSSIWIKYLFHLSDNYGKIQLLVEDTPASAGLEEYYLH